MNDQEFKRRLSEVAEWRIPDTPRETSLNAKRKRGRKSKEELYQDEHEEIFLELFDGSNPTYPPMLTRVKYQTTICNDCGRSCSQACQKEKKLYETAGKRHWRERCLTCERARNPYTGQFDLTFSEASTVWNSFLRDSKGAYDSKGNRAKESGIIRIYPETEQPL